MRAFVLTKDKDYLVFISGILKSVDAGCVIESADSLRACHDYFKRGRADIVIADFDLADSEGIDTYFNVRSRTRGMPVVIVEDSPDDTPASKAVEMGAQDSLKKSDRDQAAVSRVLRRAIQRNKAHQEHCENLLLDEATGLFNRRGFVVLAEQHLKTLTRSPHGVVVFAFSITNLNKVNQDLGFKEGNRMLARAAEVLRASFRKSDLLSRFEGNQFVICALDAAKNSVDLLAQRLKNNLKFYNDNVDEFLRFKVDIGATYADATNVLSIDELAEVASVKPV